VSGFRIVFDEDGYPRELRTSADRERAIARGALTPDTDIVIYRDGEPAYACKAGSIRDLWGHEEKSQSEMEGDGAVVPSSPQTGDSSPVGPPAVEPPPARLPRSTARRPKPHLWASASSATPVPATPTPATKPPSKSLEKQAPSRAKSTAGKPKGGCLTTLFWLVVIYILLKAFA
jgi:hypothetical protein